MKPISGLPSAELILLYWLTITDTFFPVHGDPVALCVHHHRVVVARQRVEVVDLALVDSAVCTSTLFENDGTIVPGVTSGLLVLRPASRFATTTQPSMPTPS